MLNRSPVSRTKQRVKVNRTFAPRVRVETNAQYLKRLRHEAWLEREKASDQLRQYGPWLLDTEAEALVADLKGTPAPAGIDEAEWRKLIGLDAEISPIEFKRLVDLLIGEAVRLIIGKKR